MKFDDEAWHVAQKSAAMKSFQNSFQTLVHTYFFCRNESLYLIKIQGLLTIHTHAKDTPF